MNRTDLTNLIVTRGAAKLSQLHSKSIKELEDILDKSLLEGIRAEAAQDPAIVERQRKIDEINEQRRRDREEHHLNLIFRIPVNDKIAIDNIANRGVIRSWVNETKGEAITPAWFTKVLNEQPQLASQLTWQSADVLDPAKRRRAEAAQDAEERRVFHDFCRDNGFSEVDANFSLAKNVLGSFDQYTLAQAVHSNALELAKASPEEFEQFRQEAIELHNQHLLSLDLPTLRKLAREAGARGPAASELDQVQTVRAAEKSHNNQFRPLLPDSRFKGEIIDSELVEQLSSGDLKQLLHIYGADAINVRIREWNSKVQPNLY
jgi:hypothetical protein